MRVEGLIERLQHATEALAELERIRLEDLAGEDLRAAVPEMFRLANSLQAVQRKFAELEGDIRRTAERLRGDSQAVN